MKSYLISGIIVAMSIALLFSCKHEPSTPGPVNPPVDSLTADAQSNFPPEVSKILLNKCATAGCHNQASGPTAANNLVLDSWDHLFNGGANGAEVIPFQPQFSPLLYFINTDSAQGIVAGPAMPYNNGIDAYRPPLSKDEYKVLHDWIARGAPDRKGNVPFASNPDSRQKIYITQQGCDLLAVIDAEKKVVMRYIPIGMSAGIESPHCVRISADGRYAYVSFLGGGYVQKIDTRLDTVIASAYVDAVVPGGQGGGSWNIVYISPNPSKNTLLASDWVGNGLITSIDATSMQVGMTYGYGGGSYVYPHGIESNAAFDTFFVTGQYGNVVYRIAQDGSFTQLSINGNPPSVSASSNPTNPNPDPHEILMVPDRSRYFLTCQSTNEVRVMDAHTNTVLASIPVGTFPQELAMSTTMPYMFVTCMEDAANTVAGARGSVYVIDYNTYQVVKVIYGDFYQPHGITIDDKSGIVYIASTNANPDGPAPHHATVCGGRSGWYSIYDLNTLRPFNTTRYELSVMPYSAAVRFKQ